MDSVRVLGELLLRDFARRHAAARRPLERFLEIVRHAEWKHLPDVKKTFPPTDPQPKTGCLIFDIGGNKYRLIASVDFEEQIFLVEAMLTHHDYERKN